MAEPEAMPADAIVHEMDTPESEEDACSWRALMETLAAVGDPPKRGSARSDDVTSEEPSIVAPFVRPDAVPARAVERPSRARRRVQPGPTPAPRTLK